MGVKTILSTVICPHCQKTYAAQICERFARRIRKRTLGFPPLIHLSCLNASCAERQRILERASP